MARSKGCSEPRESAIRCSRWQRALAGAPRRRLRQPAARDSGIARHGASSRAQGARVRRGGVLLAEGVRAGVARQAVHAPAHPLVHERHPVDGSLSPGDDPHVASRLSRRSADGVVAGVAGESEGVAARRRAPRRRERRGVRHRSRASRAAARRSGARGGVSATLQSAMARRSSACSAESAGGRDRMCSCARWRWCPARAA